MYVCECACVYFCVYREFVRGLRRTHLSERVNLTLLFMHACNLCASTQTEEAEQEKKRNVRNEMENTTATKDEKL